MVKSKLEKAIPRRVHKERQQLKSRRGTGLLEKHKDYQIRSRKKHQKEANLKLTKELIRNKNPDEYHSDMVHAKKKKGRTFVEKPILNEVKSIKKETRKHVMKTSELNLNLLRTRKQMLYKNIEKLKNQLGYGHIKNQQHTVYVNQASDVRSFEAESHFQSPIPCKENRYKLEKLLSHDLKSNDKLTEIGQANQLKLFHRLESALKDFKVVQKAIQEIEMARSITLNKEKIEKIVRSSNHVNENLSSKLKDVRRVIYKDERSR